ncbi:MAG TPA: hypothetical protein VJH97_05585 [Candidatus Nanoarchaeia archaeon]|nr:hypothetical protein [Candidatus Nanoarchaeia archaeon]
MSLKDLTKNEMGFVLAIFKSPEQDYNTSDIARLLDISAMGALKIARRLEKENILRSKMVGKARVHKLNKENEYVQDYVRFLLKREAEQAPPPIKMWITELRKLTAADAAVLFGSVLRKKDPEDIDVLLITDEKKFSRLKKEIENTNLINLKRLHPVYQTKVDIRKNIQKQDAVVLNAIKGIVAFGEDQIIDLL